MRPILKKFMLNPIIIEPSEESLRILDEKFVPVAEDRFIYSLQQKKFTIEGVRTFNSRLQISYDYTMKEYNRLKEFKKSYNTEYPTNHKKYLSTAIELMSKIRSTLSAYTKITDEFQPKKKRGRKQKKRVTAYDQTPLYHGAYSQDMFSWDAYEDEAVRDMLKTLNDYLELAGKCVDLCLEIIADEKAVRSDPVLANALYEDSFNRSVSNQKQMIEWVIKMDENIDNDLVKAMEQAEDVKQLVADLYHTLNHSEFNFYCVCKTVSDGRKAGMTPEEAMLFGKDNIEKVVRIRTLLDHIQELASQRDDIVGWKGMLDGEFVMHLLFWCGWNGSKNESMLRYVTERCRGKFRVVKMGAVLSKKRLSLRLDNKDRFSQQSAFNAQMDEFVDACLNNTAEKK